MNINPFFDPLELRKQKLTQDMVCVEFEELSEFAITFRIRSMAEELEWKYYDDRWLDTMKIHIFGYNMFHTHRNLVLSAEFESSPNSA